LILVNSGGGDDPAAPRLRGARRGGAPAQHQVKDRGIDANAIEHLFVQHDRYPVTEGREALEQTLEVRYLAVA
jgi:hypothetical protein